MVTSIFPKVDMVSDALQVSLLSRRLVEHGHEVHIAYSEDASVMKGFQPCKQYENMAIHPIRLPLGRWNIYLGLLLGSPLLTRYSFNKVVERVQPDVIHYHNIGLLGYKILGRPTTLMRCISILTCHDYWPICQEGLLSGYGRDTCPRENGKTCLFGCVPSRNFHVPQFWRTTGVLDRTLKGLDIVVAPSKFLEQRLKQQLGGTHVERIPFFAPISPEETDRLHLSQTSFGEYFFFSGKLESHKGLTVLAEAFRQARGDTKRKLVISGKGRLVTWLLNYVKRHGLERRVIYLGRLSREAYVSTMHSALAVIVPSYSDLFPVVPLEALSLGTPVIGTKTGGIIDMIEDLDESLMFAPGDSQSLARIMESFDPARYARERVRALYEQKFSIERHYEHYMRLISSFE